LKKGGGGDFLVRLKPYKKEICRRKKVHPLKIDNRGFTILEVIVAVSVLTIGILAMGVLQTSTVRLNNNAKGITEASAWAADQMEYLMSLPRWDVTSNPVLPVHADLAVGAHQGPVINGYDIDWFILDNGPVVNGNVTYKSITVTVSWSNLGTSGSQRSVSLNFIKAQLI